MIPRDFSFPGWHCLGQFPEGDPDGVGSWLLYHNGEAMLLEVPPGLTVDHVQRSLDQLGCTLRFITASHLHWDHHDVDLVRQLKTAFPKAWYLKPSGGMPAERILRLAGEPLAVLNAPKHSRHDQVVIFRGTVMTGDIELGQLASVNREVPAMIKRLSLHWLASFPARHGYHVHTVMSAHLNDLRQDVDWPSLFQVEEGAACG